MKDIQFKQLDKVDNIKEVIKSSFEVELDISGEWGYAQDKPLIVHSCDSFDSFAFMFASIRANIEMSMVLDEDDRYSGINLTLIEKEELPNSIIKVTYKIEAMKNSIYKKFIKEYKEGYGKEAFDMNDHFKRRKEATLTREVVYYFEVSTLQ